MSEPTRDGLDFAIDRVATRLVSVEPDEILASRIAARLPERSRSHWGWLAPQLAAAAGVLLFAFLLFSNRSTNEVEPIAPVSQTIAAAPPVEAPATVAPRPAVAPPVAPRKFPTMVSADNSFDRDFGLKPVPTPEAITLPALAAAREIDVPAREVEPLVLTDLPLASDSPSPRWPRRLIMRRFLSFAFIAALSAAAPIAVFAQDARADAQAPSTLQTPQGPVTAQPKTAREPEKVAPPARVTNVQIEITLSDQVGSAAPVKKTVSLITADSSMGRIRSEASGFDQTLGRPVQIALNLDAMPRLTNGGEVIQLSLTIEYRPLKRSVDGKSEGPVETQLNQSLTVNMTSGKPMVVSQAADPATDRKIVVEAKATILK